MFIDASNLWEAMKANCKFVDFTKLVNYLRKHFDTDKIKVYYYTAYPAEGTRSYSTSPKHAFFTFLSRQLGFVMRKKPLKQIHVVDGDTDIIREKGNMDVEITIDAVNQIDNYDIAIFFSGDSDFLPLVSFIRRSGRKVYVFSSKDNVSKEMATGSDGYIDILKIQDDIWGKEITRRE